LVTVPWFALVDGDGRVVRPGVPTDECRKPRRETLAALGSLPYQTVAERRIRPLRSPQAIDTGCPEEWKDIVAMDAEDLRPSRPRPVFDRLFDRLLVCTYRSSGKEHLPVGLFTSGREIRGEDLSDLLAALNAAGPARSCNRRHSAFAVLHPADGAEAYVEIDGCQRVLAPDRTLRQADAHLIDLVIAATDPGSAKLAPKRASWGGQAVEPL